MSALRTSQHLTHDSASGDNSTTMERFGFSCERGGAHSARTMMLGELRTLLAYVSEVDAPKIAYLDAVQSANCLGKRSAKTRVLTYRHLVDLYSLDPSFPLFRALRFFWQRDVEGQPLLAALCAYSRDPIFRGTASFLLEAQEGATVRREAVEEFIDSQEPGRFSTATLKSTAQNVNSSWTQSGHLCGRARKIRTRPTPTPGSVSFALLLGYVTGLRGESLFHSEYTRILETSFERNIDLAVVASQRDWISLKRVGKVVEVLFPRLITAQEMECLREPS